MAKEGAIENNLVESGLGTSVRDEQSEGGAVATPSRILLVGASDAEVRSIESLCLPKQIMVIPLPLDQSVESAQVEAADALVLSVKVLDQHSENRVSRWHSLGLPILCILSPEDAANTEQLSRLRVEDFFFRPYRSEEFICRLRVLLAKRKSAVTSMMIEKRRFDRRQSDRTRAELKPKLITRNSLIIDPRAKCVFRNGEEIKLTRREYSVLSFLAAEPGRVRSSEEIVEEAWNGAKRANSSDVQQYIHMLRKKIESDYHAPCWIITVKGFGYKLEVPS